MDNVVINSVWTYSLCKQGGPPPPFPPGVRGSCGNTHFCAFFLSLFLVCRVCSVVSQLMLGTHGEDSLYGSCWQMNVSRNGSTRRYITIVIWCGPNNALCPSPSLPLSLSLSACLPLSLSLSLSLCTNKPCMVCGFLSVFQWLQLSVFQ